MPIISDEEPEVSRVPVKCTANVFRGNYSPRSPFPSLQKPSSTGPLIPENHPAFWT
ncbi:hypothetical protein KQX54_000129, partial [Cotesia glomerata]